jgi:hypothetical protein
MAQGVPQKRVDQALADWREAERTLDVAVQEREAAEEQAQVVARAEEKVAQAAAQAKATVAAAEQAQQSAQEAVAAVAEVAETTEDQLDSAIDAERSAKAAREAARARHRASQDEAMKRYRAGGGPEADRPDQIDEAQTGEVSPSGRPS